MCMLIGPGVYSRRLLHWTRNFARPGRQLCGLVSRGSPGGGSRRGPDGGIGPGSGMLERDEAGAWRGMVRMKVEVRCCCRVVTMEE